MKKYTGIGSTKTPNHICIMMTKISRFLERNEYTLRSGNAKRADKAFEEGVIEFDNKEIYYPTWDIIQDNPISKEMRDKAFKMALDVHPSPKYAKKYELFLGRNPFQLFGRNLDDPSKFVICWTEGGKDTGGTGTNIRLAEKNGIPILNLYSMSLGEIIKSLSEIDKNLNF